MAMNGLGSKGWRIGARIGEGNFAVVHEAYCKCTGHKVVAKLAKPESSTPDLRKEADLMSRVRHENVIKIYAIVPDQYGRRWVIMERASSTLEQAVQADGPWNDCFVARRSIELLSALKEVHSKRIRHRDVHIENVLVTYWTDQSEPSIKLSDFGISKLLDEDSEGLAFTACGRCYEVAPELLINGYTSEQSDIYQAGLCMYYMATGLAAIGPSDGTPKEAILSGIARRRAERLERPLMQIIAKMLRRRVEYRYENASEVLVELHAFLLVHDA